MAETVDEFEKSVNPHDAAFKSAFQKKRLATSFFRNYLPKNIVKHVDFRSLRISDRSYVDEKLKDRHSDIVYQAKIRGGIGFLYLLFAHQSAPDHRS